MIENAREHPLVRDNLAIPDLGVVAYAGVPLITPDRHVIGAFCIIDGVPHQWSADELALASDFAAAATTELDSHDTVLPAARAQVR